MTTVFVGAKLALSDCESGEVVVERDSFAVPNEVTPILGPRSDDVIFKEVGGGAVTVAEAMCTAYDLIREVGVIEKRDRAVVVLRKVQQRTIVNLPQVDALSSRHRLASPHERLGDIDRVPYDRHGMDRDIIPEVEHKEHPRVLQYTSSLGT